MMARRGYFLLKSRGISIEHPNRSPCFLLIQSIQIVTGGDARFAAGALIEIDFERVLLAGLRSREGQQIAINTLAGAESGGVMRAREFYDWRNAPLFSQKEVNQTLRLLWIKNRRNI